ncbi:MAG TPA: ankyrin repeat domain-containing protein [Pyrinomonadaceae bacterium]|nr:ankyrin repeat domain-containing protein [Pyrinomonadaceae bacterium]
MEPPIVIAALTDNYDAVKLLLDKGANINAADRNGATAFTALMIAKSKGNEEIVKALTAAGTKEDDD